MLKIFDSSKNRQKWRNTTPWYRTNLQKEIFSCGKTPRRWFVLHAICTYPSWSMWYPAKDYEYAATAHLPISRLREARYTMWTREWTLLQELSLLELSTLHSTSRYSSPKKFDATLKIFQQAKKYCLQESDFKGGYAKEAYSSIKYIKLFS